MGSFNPGTSTGLFTKLSDTTLAVDGRFDISGLSQTHVTLWLILSNIRSDVAAISDSTRIFFNGDTTETNYKLLSHRATNAAHDAQVADQPAAGIVSADTSPANYVASSEIKIYDYAGSKNKIVYIVSIMRGDATTINLRQHIVQWENTAAITQVTYQPDGFGGGDLFLADMRLQIYGID